MHQSETHDSTELVFLQSGLNPNRRLRDSLQEYCDMILNARIVGPGKTSIARQWLNKTVPVAMDTRITIQELLEEVFFMWSVLKL
jgi:hypothetical protein